MKIAKRVLWLFPAAALFALQGAGTVFAAADTVRQNDKADADIMDSSKTGSLTIYKYDMTAAGESGLDLSSLKDPSGEADKDVERLLTDYAVEGVELSYLYCGKAETYSSSETQQNRIELVYEVPRDLAELLGMDPEDAFDMSESVPEPCSDQGVYHYSSAQINDALKNFLENGESGQEDGNKLARDALEEYMKNSNGRTAMPLTDENGKTEAEGLSLGLYLLVETKVPENVTETADPWFAALPFTDEEGEQWLYDITCYPKNQTGNPTLEKLVQNATENVDGTDKNTKDYAETATVSEGDVLNYLLVSKMPHIHSWATYLTQYSFRDVLSEGLEYNQDVKIAFYTSEEAAGSNDLNQAAEIWGEDRDTAGLYRQICKSLKTEDGSESGLTQLDVVITDEGLEKINRDRSDYWIVVFYTVTVNADASAVLGDEGNPNDAELTWRRTSDSYYDTLEDSCTVYTYGLQLEKQFSDGGGDPRKAEFILYNSTDGCYLLSEHTGTIDDRKVYYITGKTSEKEAATRFSPAGDGAFCIYGMEADDYVLTETDTDAGYQILKDPIEISIHSTEGMGEVRIPASASVDGQEAELCEFVLTDETYIVNDTDFASGIVNTVQQEGEIRSGSSQVVLEVTNHRKFLLPQTGGTGSYLLTIAGLAAAAAGIFVGERSSVKRKNRGPKL